MDDTSVSIVMICMGTIGFILGYIRGRFTDSKFVETLNKNHKERLDAIDASYDKQVALINLRADELRAEIDEAQRKLSQGG